MTLEHNTSGLNESTYSVNTSHLRNDEVSSNIASYSQVTLQIIYMVIGSLGFTGNVFVIVVIFNYTAMRKKITNIFIINQSFIDAISSICILCIAIFTHDGSGLKGISGDLICCLWLTRAPLWSFLMSSTYNLLAVTVERYLEIVHPIWHKAHFTPKMAYWVIAFVWIFGPAYNLAYEVPTSRVIDGKCFAFAIWPSPLVQSLVGVLTVFLQFFFPLFILSFCYIRMAIVIHQRIAPLDSTRLINVNSIANNSGTGKTINKDKLLENSPPNLTKEIQSINVSLGNTTNKPSTSAPQVSVIFTTTQDTEAPTTSSSQRVAKKSISMMKAKQNIIKSLVIVSICYTICWVWNEIFILLYFLGRPTDFSGWFYHFTVVAVFLNCCINPFIYIAKYKQFQAGVKKLFKRCTTSNPNMGGTYTT